MELQLEVRPTEVLCPECGIEDLDVWVNPVEKTAKGQCPLCKKEFEELPGHPGMIKEILDAVLAQRRQDFKDTLRGKS